MPTLNEKFEAWWRDEHNYRDAQDRIDEDPKEGFRSVFLDGGQAEREEVTRLIPTTWLDPLLAGLVIGKPPYNGTDMERLLRAIQARIKERDNG